MGLNAIFVRCISLVAVRQQNDVVLPQPEEQQFHRLNLLSTPGSLYTVKTHKSPTERYTDFLLNTLVLTVLPW